MLRSMKRLREGFTKMDEGQANTLRLVNTMVANLTSEETRMNRLEGKSTNHYKNQGRDVRELRRMVWGREMEIELKTDNVMIGRKQEALLESDQQRRAAEGLRTENCRPRRDGDHRGDDDEEDHGSGGRGRRMTGRDMKLVFR